MLRIWVIVTLVAGVLAFSCAGRQSLHEAVAPQQATGEAIGSFEQALNSALGELDALALPKNVEPKLFNRLKSALAEALSARGEAKLVSRPPSGAANAVSDLEVVDNGDGTYSLVWSYVNAGDYNQDSIVNIMDVTPLAAHFNETAEPTNEWIDGNRDGGITILDVTPLAAGFFCELADYAVETSDDEGASWDEVARVNFSEGVEEPAGTRKSFVHLLTDPVEMALYRVVPYDSIGVEPGPESAPARFTSAPPALDLSDETPANAGEGTCDAPYLVEIDTQYRLVVMTGETEVTTELSFETLPPAFIAISEESPFMLTVENELAGDFWVQAAWRELAPLRSNKLYFRVEAQLPP